MPRTWLATHADADDVTRLLVAFRDHWGESSPSDSAFAAGVAKLMDDANTDFVLASVDDDTPAQGVAQLRFRYGIWRAGTECVLEDLFVDETARGAGLGRALMDAVLVRAQERDARQIELDTEEGNEPAVSLYASYGLTPRRSPDSPLRLQLRAKIDAPEF